MFFCQTWGYFVLIKVNLAPRSGGSLQVFKQSSDTVSSAFCTAVSRKEEELVEGEKRGRGICVTLFQGRAGQSLSSQETLRIERKGRGETHRDKIAIEYGGGVVGNERLPRIGGL